MASANPSANPLQQVGLDLMGKALDYLPAVFGVQNKPCLLYTSDAADE